MKCWGCGCTDARACEGHCSWTIEHVCSTCVPVYELLAAAWDCDLYISAIRVNEDRKLRRAFNKVRRLLPMPTGQRHLERS